VNNQYVLFPIGVTIVLFAPLLSSVLQTSEAFDWDNVWKPFKYERWNCCPEFNPILNSESVNSNKIIQNVEINQIRETAQVCLIDLHDLNNQIAYINTEYSSE
jgi:hypothetical protein